MAHVQKFTKGSIAGLSIHIERKTDKHANPDIDNNQTALNYDLCQKEGDMMSRLTERLSEVHCLNRANVNIMADWIVTLPEPLKELSPDQQKQFFVETHSFLESRYGEKNVICSAVHNDETTPHLHFSFIPVIYDQKKDHEKVSAKEVLTRNELRSFHQELDRHLKETIPELYQGGILNKKTIGVENVKELKQQSDQIDRLQLELDEQKRAVEDKKSELVEIKEDIGRETFFIQQELYQAWRMDWLETKKELPDFNMRIQLENYTANYSGVSVVDEDTPTRYSLNPTSIFDLIRQKIKEVKEYLVEMVDKFKSKALELSVGIEVSKTEKEHLKGELGALNIELRTKNQTNEQLTNVIEDKTTYLKKMIETSELSYMMPNYVKPSKLNKNLVVLPLEKWEQKHVSANTVGEMMKLKDTFERRERNIERNGAAVTDNTRLRKENMTLKRELNTYHNGYIKFWNVFADMLNKQEVTPEYAKGKALPAEFKQDFGLSEPPKPTKNRSKGLARGLDLER